jgi:superfamily I DNA/RNA helicase
MSNVPSPQQVAYREALLTTTSSVQLEAVAGSGKTTTLVGNLDALKGDTALIAFNKKIADELASRVSRLSAMVQLATKAGTAHSFGFGVYKENVGGKCRVDGGKVNFILKDLLSGHDWDEPIVRSKSIIKKLVGLAKNHGFGITGQKDCNGEQARYPMIEDSYAWEELIYDFGLEPELGAIWTERLERGMSEVIQRAQTALKMSNNQRFLIDFDDMIYLPLLLSFTPKRKFHNVLVDEAQDLNKTRQELCFLLLHEGGRLISVGDPAQAIYGFTGADVKSLETLAKRTRAIQLPLSVCWRCDGAIVREAQKQVPHITSAPNKADAGIVRELPYGDDFYEELKAGDALLCRLNKPNVQIAIELLRRGKTPRIEGRDLGQQLMRHARLAAPDGPDLEELRIAIEDYKTHQIMVLSQREKHSQASMLEDECDAVQVLIDRCLETGKHKLMDLEALCNELFIDEGNKLNVILLCSIHKAKGLEWPRVYILGRFDYMPFWRAEMDWEKVQEQNLIYVAVTRAEHELVYVTDVASALDKQKAVRNSFTASDK